MTTGNALRFLARGILSAFILLSAPALMLIGFAMSDTKSSRRYLKDLLRDIWHGGDNDDG